jgi:sarcosine oxidase subunit alpha
LGKSSLQKQAFNINDRQTIVGLVPMDKKTSIPEGSHLVKDKDAKLPNPKLGHVSSSCWSVENNNPFSLAIIKDGRKIGRDNNFMQFHH